MMEAMRPSTSRIADCPVALPSRESTYARALHRACVILEGIPQLARSEEHTSELQSPCNLVCRLLLEKKKFSISHTHFSVLAIACPLHTPLPLSTIASAAITALPATSAARVDFAVLRISTSQFIYARH